MSQLIQTLSSRDYFQIPLVYHLICRVLDYYRIPFLFVIMQDLKAPSHAVWFYLPYLLLIFQSLLLNHSRFYSSYYLHF